MKIARPDYNACHTGEKKLTLKQAGSKSTYKLTTFSYFAKPWCETKLLMPKENRGG